MNRHNWLHTNDPLSLADASHQGPARGLLERISNAWAHANRNEVLHLCRTAMQCASQTNDVAGTALAQLYLADAQARSNHLEEGINFARRAMRGFRLLGEHHNTMVAHLLLARLERASQNFESARLEYQEALDICRRLRSEAKETAHRETALRYEQITAEIQQALEDIDTAIADQFDQICRLLDSIPILRLSDGPGTTVLERSNVVGYVSTGEFLIAGRTYYLHPLNETPANRLELKAGTVHFALPVSEDGWLDPASKEGDYVLVRQETQVTQEGPGVLWTGEEWVGGRFERDVTTGDVRFVASQPHIIGKEHGYAIALLKPMA